MHPLVTLQERIEHRTEEEQGSTELCLGGQLAVNVPVGVTAECSCISSTAAGIINCVLSLWSGVTAPCSRDASN